MTGKRWSCPLCQQRFLSVQDLEHCALTAEALKLFGKDVSALRPDVELRANGTMKLLPKKRTGQERESARDVRRVAGGESNSTGSSAAVKSTNENMEVIELD